MENTKQSFWKNPFLQDVKTRIAPFSVLIEARYLPLLLLALPQAYTVCLWLNESNQGKPAAEVFAVIGAAAFEFTYIGSIAWAEGKTENGWVFTTAISALIFSILVACRVYWTQESGFALLHAGFPFVAFFYTMVIHGATKKDIQPTIQQEDTTAKQVTEEAIQAVQSIQSELYSIKTNQEEYTAAMQTIVQTIQSISNQLLAVEQTITEQSETIRQLPEAQEITSAIEKIGSISDNRTIDTVKSANLKKGYSLEEKQAIVNQAQQLLEAGKSQMATAAQLGITRVTLIKWLEEMKQKQ